VIWQQKTFNIKKFPQSIKTVFALFLFTTGSYAISQVLQRTLKIDPLDQVDQTSAVAFAILVVWLTALTSFLLLILLVIKQKLELTDAFRRFLEILILSVSGVATGSSFLGLKGTPFYFGLWTGDLGVHMGLAVDAKNNLLPNSNYPPLWPTIVAGITRIFDLNIYTDYKLVNILSVPIFVFINLILFKNAFPKIIAEVLALITTFSFITYGWKTAGNLWSQIILLILIKSIYENFQVKTSLNGSYRLKIFILGGLFGLSVSLYYNRLWWIGLSIAAILVATNFLKDKRYQAQKTVIDFSFGALLILGPLFLGRLKGVPIVSLLSVIMLLGIFWVLVSDIQVFSRRVSVVAVNLAALLIVAFVSIYSVGDSFIYPDLFGDVVPDFQLNTIFDLFFVIFIFIFGTIGIIKIQKSMFPLVLFLFANLLSACLMMFFFATKMYQTRLVELWPRAAETVLQSWEIIIVTFSVYTLLLLSSIIDKANFVPTDLASRRSIKLITTSIVAITLLAFVSQKLGDSLWSLYPREGNYTMYSYLEIPDWIKN